MNPSPENPTVPSAQAATETREASQRVRSDDGSARESFERWITSPPLEKDITRNSTDEEKSAWPGQYRSYEVQLAWEAWCAAIEDADTLAAHDGIDGRRRWWSGGSWLYPGDRIALLSAPNSKDQP